jgi:hypothetical protein
LKGADVTNLKVRDLPEGQRKLKRIQDYLGKRFDHYQPAAYFQREQDKLLGTPSDKTPDRFDELFEQINSTLLPMTHLPAAVFAAPCPTPQDRFEEVRDRIVYPSQRELPAASPPLLSSRTGREGETPEPQYRYYM